MGVVLDGQECRTLAPVEDQKPKAISEMIAYIALALMAFVLVGFACFLRWRGADW